jgi:hypothetical protein
MPSHIDSVNQLRDFVSLVDMKRNSFSQMSSRQKNRLSAIKSRLAERLKVDDPEELVEDIRRIAIEFDRAMKECATKKIPKVTLGCTHMMSVRLIPSLLKLYHHEMGDDAPKVELIYDMKYREENERSVEAKADLSLTYRKIGTTHFEGRELVRGIRLGVLAGQASRHAGEKSRAARLPVRHDHPLRSSGVRTRGH